MAGELTPDGWAKAWHILSGADPEKVSLRAAALAAGLNSARELKSWIARSREKRPEDEPWVWTIAELVDSMDVERGATLEDLAWEMANKGVKKQVIKGGKVLKDVERREYNMEHLFKLLRKYDPTFQEQSTSTVEIRHLLDNPAEILQRLQAVGKLAMAQQAAIEMDRGPQPIDAEFEELINAEDH